MTLLKLTPLTADLLPAAVAFDRLCLGGLWTLDGYQRELDSPNSDLLVLQSIEPPAPQNPQHTFPSLLGLACVWAIADEAHITILAVHPDYRHQGLGQLLLQTLLTLAQRRSLKWATLEVRISNEAAIALYKKFGFESVGQRKRYYQDTGEDALILWLKGLQDPQFNQVLQQGWDNIFDRLKQAGWQISNTLPLDLGTPF
ncbi:MAG TPA: ribosomal protein S18-alanine N-acetyltransferase [Allocoleopsis sp.]